MEHQSPKAILVVSFGTSYEASRKATIEKIEQDIADAFPDYRIYHAWTSKFIISVLKKRDGISIPTVCEAIEQMIHDGIRYTHRSAHTYSGWHRKQCYERGRSFS